MLFLRNKALFFLFFLFFLTGCSYKSYYEPQRIINSKSMHKATMRPYKVGGKTYYPTRVSIGSKYRGIASWYGPDFHGNKTSNGERYNMYALTAAHKTLPMNTVVKVRNLRNNKTVVVRINDRGPFVAGRIIDLSKIGANKIGLISSGTAPVELTVLGFNNTMSIPEKSQWKKPLPSVPEYIEGGNFMVQIGAFRNYSGALTYKKKFNLIKNIYKTKILSADLGGYDIHRVFLSGFRSEEEARDFIKEGRFRGAYIVRD